MKHFQVDIDITMSKRLYLVAESEDDARSIVEKKFEKNPYDVAYSFDAYVGHEITSVDVDYSIEKQELL